MSFVSTKNRMHKFINGTVVQRTLLFSGIGFLIAYAVPIIIYPLNEQIQESLHYVEISVWLVFAGEYLVQVFTSTNRKRYIKSHPFELIILLIPTLRALRGIRAILVLSIINRRKYITRLEETLTKIFTLALAMWFVGGLAVADAERNAANATINGVADGWWWAISTMTTVGYGDKYPVTSTGRTVGYALMLMGISVLASVTASFAAALSSSSEDVQEIQAELLDTESTLSLILEELQSLKSAQEDLSVKRDLPPG